MKLSNIFFKLCFSALFVPSLLFAASSDFTITTQIVNDVTPPTTPTILTVVPIASTQINVTWSAATDDVAIGGYRVFRDTVQIATTTLLSYSDTGLTASTTYSYTVDAFDLFENFSSTSGAIATTTLANPPPVVTSTTTSKGSAGTRTTPTLVTIDIVTTAQSAQFNWKTKEPTQYTLVWGRTSSYELGTVSGSIYNINHATNIDNLEPGTTYYYELRAINVLGNTEIISRDRFVTQNSLAVSQVPNVQGFVARVDGLDVELSWANLFTQTNYFVRVVRSHLFYPGTIESGAVVYEGRGQSFVDTEALGSRSPQYYTIFVLDGNGNVSSGAVARAFKAGEPVLEGNPVASSTEVPNPINVPSEIGNDQILRSANISIVQLEEGQTFDTDIALDANLPYLVSIPYTSVPKNLKSIIVTVQHPGNQRDVSVYLLKLNQTGDAYTAYIPGPGIVGQSKIIIEVFDFEESTVRRVITTVTFEERMAAIPFFPDRLIQYSVTGTGLALPLLSVWWLRVLLRRRRQRDA